MIRPSLNRSRGFTLIEVLVVVGIIALLVSILLPSLSKARDQARAAVCAADMSQVTRAQQTYQTTNRGFFAGSPYTSGRSIAEQGGYDPSAPGFNRFVVEWYDYATPLRREMYGANSIANPKLGDQKQARISMFKASTEGIFHCPSNQLVVPPYPANNGFPAIQGVSYLTMWTLMRPGPAAYEAADEWLAPDLPAGWAAQSAEWEMGVPSDYEPRIERLSKPEIKVFVADGFRYYGGESTLDYNTEAAAPKGAMSGAPPSDYRISSSTPTGPDDFSREYVYARKYSYRHRNGRSIQAAFFDGHVESLLASIPREPYSEQVPTIPKPFSGEAVNPKYYYPSGTVVKETAISQEKLHRLDMLPGTKLP